MSLVKLRVSLLILATLNSCKQNHANIMSINSHSAVVPTSTVSKALSELLISGFNKPVSGLYRDLSNVCGAEIFQWPNKTYLSHLSV